MGGWEGGRTRQHQEGQAVPPPFAGSGMRHRVLLSCHINGLQLARRACLQHEVPGCVCVDVQALGAAAELDPATRTELENLFAIAESAALGRLLGKRNGAAAGQQEGAAAAGAGVVAEVRLVEHGRAHNISIVLSGELGGWAVSKCASDRQVLPRWGEQPRHLARCPSNAAEKPSHSPALL